MSKAFEQSANIQFKGDANKMVFEEFQGRRILVIENDPDNQKTILSFLSRSGINLSLAQSSKESLWMLEKMPAFDLVLIAVEIDAESSSHLSQKIRSLSRYKGVPIVVMGEKSGNDYVAGIDEVLSRPIQAGELYNLLNHYLTKESDVATENRENITKASFINTATLAARDGFEMASFDEGLYTDILREFMELYGSSAVKMNQVLVKDDLQTLKQLCLDVKGVAANIGALRLSIIATQIHAAIASGNGKDLMGLIHQYQPELERVKEEIVSYLKHGSR